MVELLELANGTEHRAVRGSLIPTLYNLVPVKDMLSTRQMLQKIQRQICGPGPWPGDGDLFGCVWEWYAEGGVASAPWWGGVGEMLDDVAAALVDKRPALQTYASGAVWHGERISPQLADVDDGYLRWSTA